MNNTNSMIVSQYHRTKIIIIFLIFIINTVYGFITIPCIPCPSSSFTQPTFRQPQPQPQPQHTTHTIPKFHSTRRDDDINSPPSSHPFRKPTIKRRKTQSPTQTKVVTAFDPWEMEVVPCESNVDSQYADECRLDDEGNGSDGCFPFVRMLRDSAKYVSNHRQTIAVYHIPGELLEWDGFPALMDDIALTWLLGMRVVIVAGCRHQINARLAAQKKLESDDEDYDEDDDFLNLNSNNDPYTNTKLQPTPPESSIMPNSLRVTSHETMRVVQEESGYVRFEIERQLNRCLRLHGGADLRVPGALDANVVGGNFVSAEPVGILPTNNQNRNGDGSVSSSSVDYRHAGVPSTVQTQKIRSCLERGDVVLLTSCTTSPSGERMNVRSESMAAHVAAEMKADKLVYCAVKCRALRSRVTGRIMQNFRRTDARDVLRRWGVRVDGDYVPWIDRKVRYNEGDDEQEGKEESDEEELSRNSLEYLLQIAWANLALERGVGRVHIVAPSDGALLTELFTAKDGSGTCISQDEVEEIHPDENFYGYDDDNLEDDEEVDGQGSRSFGGPRKWERNAPFS